MPAFNNDEIVIPEFIKLGIEPQDAYDYAAIGCSRNTWPLVASRPPSSVASITRAKLIKLMPVQR
jgi:pyruvate-formate lyase